MDQFIERSGLVGGSWITAGVALILSSLLLLLAAFAGALVFVVAFGLVSLGVNLIVKGMLRLRRAGRLRDFY